MEIRSSKKQIGCLVILLSLPTFILVSEIYARIASHFPDHSWREEVQLSDGRVINIRLHQYYETTGEFAAPSAQLTKMEIEFEQWPEMNWVGDHLSPMILDVKDGKYFIISEYTSRGYWDPDCASEPKYIAMMFDGRTWVRESLTTFPNDMPRNISANGAIGNAEQPDYMTLAIKRSADYDYYITTYQPKSSRSYSRSIAGDCAPYSTKTEKEARP